MVFFDNFLRANIFSWFINNSRSVIKLLLGYQQVNNSTVAHYFSIKWVVFFFQNNIYCGSVIKLLFGLSRSGIKLLLILFLLLKDCRIILIIPEHSVLRVQLEFKLYQKFQKLPFISCCMCSTHCLGHLYSIVCWTQIVCCD